MTLVLIWVLVGGFIGGFIQLIWASSDIDEIDFGNAFFYAICFYDTYKDEINTAGLILAISFIVIFTLPGSVLIILLLLFRELLAVIWKLFKFIFRKKSNGGATHG